MTIETKSAGREAPAGNTEWDAISAAKTGEYKPFAEMTENELLDAATVPGAPAQYNTSATRELGRRADPLAEVKSQANWLLQNHYRVDFMSGAQAALAQGDLTVSPGEFIAAGFQAEELGQLSERLSRGGVRNIQRQEFQQAVDAELIAPFAAQISSEEVANLEHHALGNAIRNGIWEDTTPDGQPIQLPSLPIRQHGDQLGQFLDHYQIDRDDGRTRVSSHIGFTNILRAISSDSLEAATDSADKFTELNWYFDQFKYGQHLAEFEEIMTQNADHEDTDWQDTLLEFMLQRPEYQQEMNEVQSQLGENAVEVGSFNEMWLWFIKNSEHLDYGEVLPDFDHLFREFMDGHIGPENCPPGVLKAINFIARAQYIKENLDPNANIYVAPIKELDGQPRTYFLIRFGYDDHNCLIADGVNDTPDAMFTWKGQTGYDQEGWRPHFSKTKGYLRSQAGIERHYHVANRKKGLSIFENPYNKACRDFNIKPEDNFSKLPAPRPVSQPAAAEQAA